MLTGLEPLVKDAIYNFDLSEEERATAVAAQVKAMGGISNTEEALDEAASATPDLPGYQGEYIMAPGCPEEPETEAEVIIYRPSKATGNKLPVILGVTGGGMFTASVEMTDYWTLPDRFGCVCVCPRYRSAYQGKYPAAINDLHAGYQYVVEHADELGVDADNITITGQSSGSNLEISLAFRLKRYGYRPRGCVSICAFTDNRPIYTTSTITSGGNWDADLMFRSSVQYLGVNRINACCTPEMYPNYATPEDCIGLCPIFLHGDAEEANCASTRAFCDVLSKAGVYHELHNWGGSCHSAIMSGPLMGNESPYVVHYQAVVDGNFADCMKYDLRRAFVEELLAE